LAESYDEDLKNQEREKGPILLSTPKVTKCCYTPILNRKVKENIFCTKAMNVFIQGDY
jgi:hypothetical protein